MRTRKSRALPKVHFVKLLGESSKKYHTDGKGQSEGSSPKVGLVEWYDKPIHGNRGIYFASGVRECQIYNYRVYQCLFDFDPHEMHLIKKSN